MNEGHSALLALALLEQRLGAKGLRSATEEDIRAVRSKCVFTTHTPVPAGKPPVPRNLVSQVLADRRVAALETTDACREGSLNMTYLALFGSHHINGVAMQHGEVSRSMFPRYPIRAITNERPCRNLDSARISRSLRSAHRRVAARQPIPPVCDWHSRQRRSGGSRAG
jgi:starch phosphorylase